MIFATVIYPITFNAAMDLIKFQRIMLILFHVQCEFPYCTYKLYDGEASPANQRDFAGVKQKAMTVRSRVTRV